MNCLDVSVLGVVASAVPVSAGLTMPFLDAVCWFCWIHNNVLNPWSNITNILSTMSTSLSKDMLSTMGIRICTIVVSSLSIQR